MGALNANRMMSINTGNASKSMEKLSSGLRINRAGDDAAGLAISEKMRGQIRGLNQASRNAEDGISLIQTAEGGLNEVHSLLQRGRELSVQAANGTSTVDDKRKIQEEVDQLMKEVNRISDNTEFNQISLLNYGATSPVPVVGTDDVRRKVLDALQKSMLQQGEKLITDNFGLTGDNVNIKVILDDNVDGKNGTLAFVRSDIVTNGSGKVEGTNLELHVDMADFQDIQWPNGGVSPNYLDRTIAHELVHAVFDRTLNMSQDANGDGTKGDLAVAKWFNEGSAEFLHGADERLAGAIQILGGNPAVGGAAGNASAISALVGKISNDGNTFEATTSEGYAAAYAAVKYLDYTLKMASGGTDADGDGTVTGGTIGYKQFLNELYHGGARDRDMDDAFAAINASVTAAGGSLGFSNMADFLTKFKATGSGSGQEYITKLVDKGMLTNNDTGSVGGSDTTGVSGNARNSEQTVPDTDNPTLNPLSHFTITWPDLSQASTGGTGVVNSEKEPLKIHIGANAGTTLDFELVNVRTDNLGLGNVNVVVDADHSISKFQNAIDKVSAERSRLGALQNRLEHTVANLSNSEENLTSAESRIRDTNMAKEMTIYSKNNILTQAAQAMLAQAKSQPEQVLQLLK